MPAGNKLRKVFIDEFIRGFFFVLIDFSGKRFSWGGSGWGMWIN
jgi:hypothetical protein